MKGTYTIIIPHSPPSLTTIQKRPWWKSYELPLILDELMEVINAIIKRHIRPADRQLFALDEKWRLEEELRKDYKVCGFIPLVNEFRVRPERYNYITKGELVRRTPGGIARIYDTREEIEIDGYGELRSLVNFNDERELYAYNFLIVSKITAKSRYDLTQYIVDPQDLEEYERRKDNIMLNLLNKPR